MKICGDVDSRELRQGIKIDFKLSNCLQNKLMSKKLDYGHITSCNSRCKKIKKTSFEEVVEISNTQNLITNILIHHKIILWKFQQIKMVQKMNRS